MTKEDLIKKFNEHNKDLAKYEKNKKRIRQIKREIEIINKKYSSRLTASYKETNRSNNNFARSNIEKEYERKEEEINKLQEERETIEAENIIIYEKIQDVEIAIKCLSFKERVVIKEHYIEKNSFEDIGNRVFWQLYKQTRSGDRVARIAKSALEKMVEIMK